jgi:hypothetical protein
LTDDNNLMLVRKAFRSALGYHDLLEEGEANDLAHDLSTQIGTTADMSVDRETLGSVFGQNQISSAVTRFMPPDPGRRNPPPGTPEAKAFHKARSSELISLADRLADANEILNESITDTLDHVILAKSRAFEYDSRLNVELVEDEGQIPSRREERVDKIYLFKKDGARSIVIFDHKGDRPDCRPFDPQPLENIIDGRTSTDELSPGEQREIVMEVAKLTGIDASLKRRFEPVKRSSTGLAKETIYRINDTQKTLDEIHSGWFRFGPRKPKDACYVGHAKFCGQEYYVWVCNDGLEDLEEFTRKVLKLGTTLKDVQVVTAPSGIQFSPALTNTSR